MIEPNILSVDAHIIPNKICAYNVTLYGKGADLFPRIGFADSGETNVENVPNRFAVLNVLPQSLLTTNSEGFNGNLRSPDEFDDVSVTASNHMVEAQYLETIDVDQNSNNVPNVRRPSIDKLCVYVVSGIVIIIGIIFLVRSSA